MQKKLVALAIAGLASSAAFAADNVTIYGNLDMGYVSRGGQDGGSATVNGRTNKLASGVSSLNVLGFKGSEDLGNGLSAIFALEAGFDAANGTSTQEPTTGTASGRLFSNQAYVGVTNNNFGTVVAGRLMGVRYGMVNEYDPFHGGTVGDSNSLYGHVKFANSAVAYISPNFSGFNVVAAYTNDLTDTGTLASGPLHQGGIAAGAVIGNSGQGHLWAIKPQYKNGPISVAYDHEDLNYKEGSGSLKIDVLGGSYDFGVVKVMASWDKLKAGSDLTLPVINGAAISTILPNGIDNRRTMIGASAPFGKSTFKANYIWLKDSANSDADAKKWAIGYQYDLSKRTALFADYTRVSNDRNAAYSVTTATDAGGGVGTNGVDFGLRHSF